MESIPRSEDDTGRRARRVLLMDDDPGVRALTARMAAKIGVRYQSVENADQAVTEFASARTAGDPFDVVILDLTIPGSRGGREVLVELREIEPTVIGIVISGWIEGTLMAECEAHGFNAALPKPYTARQLEEALERALG